MTQLLNYKCRYCSLHHPLEYQLASNHAKHLIYKCSNRKGTKKFLAAQYLPFIPDLPIPTNPAFKSNKSFYIIDRPHLKEAEVDGQISLLTSF